MLNRTSIWGGSWVGMTWPEIASPEVIGNDLIGSDVSVRKIIFRAFFLTGFLPRFLFETPRDLLGNFWKFPIGHSILPAEISTNENLGNSTNEMPQSLFQLANHDSPDRSNESVRTIYFWPFVEALSFVESNSNVNLCFFPIWKSAFSLQLS